MHYCGIDVAMKSSYLYITDAQGRIKGKGELPTTAEDSRRVLGRFVRGGVTVAVEAGQLKRVWLSRNKPSCLRDLLGPLGRIIRQCGK